MKMLPLTALRWHLICDKASELVPEENFQIVRHPPDSWISLPFFVFSAQGGNDPGTGRLA